ncbi:MAG: NAD-dependent deacylase [Dehalococcoidia bacterium]|nr:NAD-dependent deacylase [Dehalococcoidia bacterium]
MEDSGLVTRAAQDLVASRYAIALTGAGISTESGIPDFRGPQGIWTRNPEAEKAAYRSYREFVADPKRWWVSRLTSTSKIFSGWEEALPNPGHHALVELERLGIIRTVITQNVDGLHEKAGTKNLIEYHGSIHKLRCSVCNRRYHREEYDLETLLVQDRLPPQCRECGGVVKTDGVAFGEPIPSDVARRSLEEVARCDLMLICGTSAVVYPFASLPRIARERKAERERLAGSGLYVVEKVPAVKIIEVNLEPTPLTRDGISDYLIQGRTGEVLPQIVALVKKLKDRPR